MKKYLLALIFILGVSVAFAGDGPFPGRALVGKYQSANATVTLSIGQYIGNSIQVFAVLTDSNGNVIAKGSTFHPMEDSTLVIPLRYEDGRPGVFMAKAIDSDTGRRSNVNSLQLRVRVDFLGNATAPKDLVFNRVP